MSEIPEPIDRSSSMEHRGLKVFEGPTAFFDWQDATSPQSVKGRTLSPGGAASMLGVSRQFIHQLIQQGQIRAWGILEKPDLVTGVLSGSMKKRVTYLSVSRWDVAKYAVRVGRPMIVFAPTAEEYEELRAEVVAEEQQALDNSQGML